MVMSPLGDILMKSLSLKPSHFGFAVSAYAFSAGIPGFLQRASRISSTAKNYYCFFILALLQALSYAALLLHIHCF